MTLNNYTGVVHRCYASNEWESSIRGMTAQAVVGVDPQGMKMLAYKFSLNPTRKNINSFNHWRIVGFATHSKHVGII